MKDLSLFNEIPSMSIDYFESLRIDKSFNFLPTTTGSTHIGRKINMGYNCYAIKLYKITNNWQKIGNENRNEWINFLLDYQNSSEGAYKNYFIDSEVTKYFNNPFSTYSLKNYLKTGLSKLPNRYFEPKQNHIFKTINADNKQVISTLKEVKVDILETPNLNFNGFDNAEDYLNSYNWNEPWDAGAQFSSLSVYSEIFESDLNQILYEFISIKLDTETGSYFQGKPENSRQIINGAMKVISGLDWLNRDIHLPEKLIDFCLNNKPEFEGCDLVDYVYVLYKCSLQSTHRRKEIRNAMLEVLDYLKLLYHPEEKGFSYFINKSQQYYYGINISSGKDCADIHGTILSVWAIVMILETLEENIYKYRTIKP
jgi:hypothetical protein